MFIQRSRCDQGCRQTLKLGWAREEHFHIFFSILLFFFPHFLPQFGPLGGRLTHLKRPWLHHWKWPKHWVPVRCFLFCFVFVFVFVLLSFFLCVCFVLFCFCFCFLIQQLGRYGSSLLVQTCHFCKLYFSKLGPKNQTWIQTLFVICRYADPWGG